MKRTLVIFFFLLHLNCFGQLSMSYSMGGISLGANATSSFTGPIVLSHDKSCLQVSNGVIVFSSTARGSALFDPTCGSSVPTFNTLFSLAPNPAQGFTRLYSIGGAVVPDDNVMITVYDQAARSVLQFTCKGTHLKNGYPIETKLLSAGVYIVSINYTRTPSAGAPLTYSSTLKLINTHH